MAKKIMVDRETYDALSKRASEQNMTVDEYVSDSVMKILEMLEKKD